MKKKLFIRDLEKRKSSSSLFVSAPGTDPKLQDATKLKRFRKPSECIAMYAVVAPEKPIGESPPIDPIELRYAVTMPPAEPIVAPVDPIELRYAVTMPERPTEELPTLTTMAVGEEGSSPRPIELRYAVTMPERPTEELPTLTTMAVGEEGSSSKPEKPIGEQPTLTTMAVGEEGSSPKPGSWKQDFPKPGSWKHNQPKPGFWQWFKKDR